MSPVSAGLSCIHDSAEASRRQLPSNRNVRVSAGCGSFDTIALNPGNEAPSFSVANVNVADTAGIQKPLDASFDLLCRWAFASDDPPVLTVSFQGQRQGTQLLRKSMNFSKSRTGPCMNEHRTGRRIFVQSGEWVVCEQNAVFFTGTKLLQTRAAGAVTGGKFHVGRMPILRRPQRATYLFGKCRVDG